MSSLMQSNSVTRTENGNTFESSTPYCICNIRNLLYKLMFFSVLLLRIAYCQWITTVRYSCPYTLDSWLRSRTDTSEIVSKNTLNENIGGRNQNTTHQTPTTPYREWHTTERNIRAFILATIKIVKNTRPIYVRWTLSPQLTLLSIKLDRKNARSSNGTLIPTHFQHFVYFSLRTTKNFGLAAEKKLSRVSNSMNLVGFNQIWHIHTLRIQW